MGTDSSGHYTHDPRYVRKARSIAAWAIGLVSIPALAPTADACGWSWETYAAEATSLPCVHDALVGYFPRHTPAYHEAVIAAVDYARTWAPDWTAGLDAKGLSEMHLGRLDAARATMTRRFAIAPDAYPSHANLGTLFTFTGDHAAALEHIDAAMKLEPKAHFGREKYHRMLVVFLRDMKAEPKSVVDRNFVGVKLTTAERAKKGSKEGYERAGFSDDAIDALVSMIAVYGAEDLAEIYLSLGELLSLRGFPKLAWTAYTRAIDLKHPRANEIKKWRAEVVSAFPFTPGQTDLDGSMRPRMGFDGERVIERPVVEKPSSYWLQAFYNTRRADAEGARESYAKWEKTQIEKGLAVWTEAGVERLYAKMNEIRIRCRAPSIIDTPEPFAPGASPLVPSHQPAPCPMCPWEARARMAGAKVKDQ
jgi:tetratricopeptide (TPR) repeat protein